VLGDPELDAASAGASAAFLEMARQLRAGAPGLHMSLWYGFWAPPGTPAQIVRKLQKVMVDDIPVIPVTEGVDWYQYNTENHSGWVTQQNPYAQPSAYVYPDWAVVAMNLKPKS
jgi:hypothetical protein